MKPETVFLGEMTSPEVEAFLKTHHTVIVPVGAVEQHGPHLALLTDVLIPQEVARRAAPTLGALVAPPINYALSYPHTGFTGLVQIRIPTFMALIEDVAVSLATSLAKGMHAHAAETAAILAINPNLVVMSKANAEFPPFPAFTVNSGPVHTAFFFTSPGSVYAATKSGTWGDATTATPEMGERFLALGVKSTLAVLENIEKTFAAMPPR
jgi:creatinine amidohydrolase